MLIDFNGLFRAICNRLSLLSRAVDYILIRGSEALLFNVTISSDITGDLLLRIPVQKTLPNPALSSHLRRAGILAPSANNRSQLTAALISFLKHFVPGRTVTRNNGRRTTETRIVSARPAN